MMDSAIAKRAVPRGVAATGHDARPPRLRSALTVVALVALAGGLVALASVASQRLHDAPAAVTPEVEPVYLPDIRFLRFASLGYRNALADVLWFRTINYFGKHFHGDRLYPWLARMCDIVTDLDPGAEHVYRFAGFILPWEAQLPDEGIRMLEKGVRQFPDSWQLTFYLGFSRFYFKDDVEGALPYVKHAATLPDAHPFVARFAATLYSQQHGPETAREFLEELRDSGGAGGMELVIDERLREIELSRHIVALEAAVDAHRQRFGSTPTSLEDLVRTGLIESIPTSPFGDGYVYDAGGDEVRTKSGRRPLRLYESAKRRQILAGEDYKD